ncbi:MAG: hypothetical protein ACK55Z_32040, partial [bacterium]
RGVGGDGRFIASCVDQQQVLGFKGLEGNRLGFDKGRLHQQEQWQKQNVKIPPTGTQKQLKGPKPGVLSLLWKSEAALCVRSFAIGIRCVQGQTSPVSGFYDVKLTPSLSAWNNPDFRS